QRPGRRGRAGLAGGAAHRGRPAGQRPDPGPAPGSPAGAGPAALTGGAGAAGRLVGAGQPVPAGVLTAPGPRVRQCQSSYPAPGARRVGLGQAGAGGGGGAGGAGRGAGEDGGRGARGTPPRQYDAIHSTWGAGSSCTSPSWRSVRYTSHAPSTTETIWKACSRSAPEASRPW